MGQRKKILVVDDERDIVKALMIRLQGAGYDVVTAFDGAQGVFMAHKEKPDLIILDIRMPSGNGFSVAQRLKHSTHTFTIPVIFLTGSPDPSPTNHTKGHPSPPSIEKLGGALRNF